MSIRTRPRTFKPYIEEEKVSEPINRWKPRENLVQIRENPDSINVKEQIDRIEVYIHI